MTLSLSAPEMTTILGIGGENGVPLIVGQVRPFIFDVFTWSRDSWPVPLWAWPIAWLGPAVTAAWITSWVTGRQGTGFRRGAGVGVTVAILVAVLGCVTPIVVLSPVAGAFAAVVAVLRSG